MVERELKVLNVGLSTLDSALLLHQVSPQAIIDRSLRVKVVLILVCPLALSFQRQASRLQHVFLVFYHLHRILELFLLS